MDSDDPKLTELMNRWQKGDAEAGNELFALIERALRKMAENRLRLAGGQPPLRATEMVNQAYLRLVDQHNEWRNREQFFAIAGTLIHRTISDALRYNSAGLRDWRREVSPDAEDGIEVPSKGTNPEMLFEIKLTLERVDEALDELAKDNPLAHQVFVQRVFENKTLRQIAKELEVSEDAAERKWKYARALLARRLSEFSGSVA